MDNIEQTETLPEVEVEKKPTRRRTIPLFQTLGIEVVESEAGKSRMRYLAKPEWFNGTGVVQGGIVTAVLDAAMAMAVVPGLEDGEFFSSAEIKVTFLRGISEGEYNVEGRIIKRGSRAIFGESTIYNQKGQACATASSTMICWKEKQT